MALVGHIFVNWTFLVSSLHAQNRRKRLFGTSFRLGILHQLFNLNLNLCFRSTKSLCRNASCCWSDDADRRLIPRRTYWVTATLCFRIVRTILTSAGFSRNSRCLDFSWSDERDLLVA